MTIRYSKTFKKQYKKLSPALQQKAKDRILLWARNPNHPSLRLHQLSGKLRRFYSINITGDIRAIYEIVGTEVYICQFIGTHSQLYS